MDVHFLSHLLFLWLALLQFSRAEKYGILKFLVSKFNVASKL